MHLVLCGGNINFAISDYFGISDFVIIGVYFSGLSLITRLRIMSNSGW